jgi:hypothetical protein
LLAAQRGDGVGSPDGPSHAREFEALPDDCFAAGLDDTGADEQAAGSEADVTPITMQFSY